MFDREKIKKGVELILEGIGEDKNREGLLETPDRIARMYEEIFAGLYETAEEPLSKTFSSDNHEMVIEKDIVFYSTCEHHFMPFFGKAHVAYIPNGKVVGLSKLARTVEVFAKRPQIQEQLTEQIADALMAAYMEGKADEIHIMYNHFHSMGRQEPTHTQFLPFSLSEINAQESKVVAQDYICEPSKEKIFESLLPYLMRCKIYSLLLNSSTAEFAARTVAMQSASDNAQELLDELKLGYNKRRQQAITEELADIANSQ